MFNWSKTAQEGKELGTRGLIPVRNKDYSVRHQYKHTVSVARPAPIQTVPEVFPRG